MIYKATREIANAMDAANLKYDIVENEHTSRVICVIVGKILTFRVQFISTDDDNDVAIRVFDLVKFPEEKQGSMILFANECNNEYRYAKFVIIRNENSLRVDYDFPMSCQNPGETAMELLSIIMRMIDDVAADMMRHIWA